MSARISFRRRASDHAVALAIIAAGVVIWEAVCRLGLVSALVLPSPLAVAREFVGICREILDGGPLRNDTFVTLYESVAGFFLASLSRSLAGR